MIESAKSRRSYTVSVTLSVTSYTFDRKKNGDAHRCVSRHIAAKTVDKL